MIDPYEKIIMVMRNQSVSSGPFALGVMKDATTCSIGAIELTDEDYFMSYASRFLILKGTAFEALFD